MKRFLVALYVRSGLLALWRFRNRKRITILMLHGVAGNLSEASWHPIWERPDVERVARILAELCRFYTPITFEHAVDILEGKAPPVNYALVMTFDDGYRNNFTEALPRLIELGVPATFFIATGLVESGESYWVDRLDYALQKVPSDLRVLRHGKYEFDLRNLDGADLASAYKDLRLTLKNNEPDDASMLAVVNGLCRSLEDISGSSVSEVIDSDPHASVATWHEQAVALEQGATIGSHSVDHFRLTAVPRSDVDEQLTRSKSEIEDRLNFECRYFCYPNGSVDDFVRDRVEAAGYRAAVSTEYGLNSVGDDLYRLKRFPMPLLENMDHNLLRISGIFESRLYGAIFGRE